MFILMEVSHEDGSSEPILASNDKAKLIAVINEDNDDYAKIDHYVEAWYKWLTQIVVNNEHNSDSIMKAKKKELGIPTDIQDNFQHYGYNGHNYDLEIVEVDEV